MKILHASVLVDVKRSLHKVVELRDDAVVPVTDYPLASSVEIAQNNAGVYLFRYDIDGHFVGDTWHTTVEEANSKQNMNTAFVTATGLKEKVSHRSFLR